MLRTIKSLEGYELGARDGIIGKVRDAYVDDEHWYVRYLVVETGSWLTGRSVLISPTEISSALGSSGVLMTRLTQDQVRNSPSIDTDRPVSRQQELALSRYYTWPSYWAGSAPAMGATWGAPPPAGAGPATQTSRVEAHSDSGAGATEIADGDPHLRSAQVMRASRVEAIDGSIGHVEGLLVDDATWAVRRLIVDTRNWWPAKKVLVPLWTVTSLDWSSSAVHVGLSRDEIKRGPEYDADTLSLPDHAERLAAQDRARDAENLRRPQ